MSRARWLEITRPALAVILACGAGVALSGCELGLPAGEEPHREFNYIDMGSQPKLKPQRGDLFGSKATGGLAPVAGAVAQGEHPYRFRQDQADLAGQGGANPLPRSPEVLAKGQWVWNNACIVCHGPTGEGDGKLTRLFPKPTHLLRQKVRDYTDARIFHVPMRGQGSMPSHAKQFTPDELWAVVHHIRELQATHPVAGDDLRDVQEQIDFWKAKVAAYQAVGRELAPATASSEAGPGARPATEPTPAEGRAP